MKAKIQYFINDIKDMKIYGPFNKDTEACDVIEEYKFQEGEYFVTEHVTEIKEIDFDHQLSIFRHNKKKKKDVEVVSHEGNKQIIIAGEVVG